ncbi:hypothetical protein FOZ63_026012 [Perkinsus olseni]|uniref:Uncharacterized protein n=1 Tax=Perkinsus olseni TaxID=32597 RepID=A0A7J6SK28_PEROL|nr:hypothetical protein FOZ63_026012 [Perkinsus olseni]
MSEYLYWIAGFVSGLHGILPLLHSNYYFSGMFLPRDNGKLFAHYRPIKQSVHDQIIPSFAMIRGKNWWICGIDEDDDDNFLYRTDRGVKPLSIDDRSTTRIVTILAEGMFLGF